MAKKRNTRMKTGYGTIKCRGTRRCLRNGTETGELWGIRVTVANPQSVEVKDMAANINDAMSLTDTDVIAAWRALEGEIVDALMQGRRVSLGNLGTLSLEVGTATRKSADEELCNTEIVAKGITFRPSKNLAQQISGLAFEWDGVVKQPLADDALTAALDSYFAQHEYITVRNYATLCRCSLSTARRHIADMLVDGRLEKSGIAKGLYKRKA
ncbi:MAG: HU family DNA-binding protein [Bacteroidaceae bacterium]|nr:HU family DNA-binding protein [Bacteroidaceae bacterium]